ncbi:MAG: NAD(P)-binding protein, partial [Algicola sp.]|nr:NAD(P)-binding protein [Algicola sp.]
MKSVAVVGAGLMGRLSALSLHRKGLKVTLFDKDDKKGELS